VQEPVHVSAQPVPQSPVHAPVQSSVHVAVQVFLQPESNGVGQPANVIPVTARKGRTMLPVFERNSRLSIFLSLLFFFISSILPPPFLYYGFYVYTVSYIYLFVKHQL
jgi:hypothetical protein